MKTITVYRHNDASDDIKTNNYDEQYGKHFNKLLLEYAISNIVNIDSTKHQFTIKDITDYMLSENISYPSKSNIFDITYTANMAYADFYPNILYTIQDCIRYALAVANDVDGYEGIEFCRWLADIKQKGVDIDINTFV